MVGSLEEMEDAHERPKEDTFQPEIVCVHSQSIGDSCPRCPSNTGDRQAEQPETGDRQADQPETGDRQADQPETVQNAAYPENQVYLLPARTDLSEPGSERDPLSLDEGEEIEKESGENEGLAFEKATPPDSDINSKVRFIFHLDGLKEASGLLYIGCECDREKTNPSKIMEWFSTEFLNLHRVYAIREEEPFLLRVFTRNHESTNKGIRKKGGRKVMLMGKEVFGDVMLACGRCGYWSREGSNVRRHLKRSVCLKDRGYCKEELVGLDKTERRRFLRRVAAAKCRAKKKARELREEGTGRLVEGSAPAGTTTTTTTAITATRGNPSYSIAATDEPYAECIVEIQEQGSAGEGEGEESEPAVPLQKQRPKKRPVRYKALSLGPAVVQEAVLRVSFDIYTVSDSNERVAWKPPNCHKACPGDRVCRIVFKGARMKRRCLDLPVPKVLIYRKLDCKTHHCNFTLFHPSARAAFQKDATAKASINLKVYGGIVMTQEFYHYFVSLLSIMKMKSSQTARHLTSVWEMILSDRLGTSTIPEEHRKIITLSKQTVKSIWNSIEEAESKRGVRLLKGSRRRKKPPPAVLPASTAMPPPPLPLPPPSSVNQYSSTVNTVDVCGVVQPPLAHPCMKRLNNHMPIKAPPPPPPPTHPPPSAHALPGPHKPSMMPPAPPHPPPHPSHHNSMQQAAPHTHWLGQAPQYPHNMAPYPMAPPPPPSAEYYPMPSHFVTQYTPATMGTSP